MAAAAAAASVALVVLAVVISSDIRDHDGIEADIDALRDDVDADEEALVRLDERVGDLPVPLDAVSTVEMAGPSVFRVEVTGSQASAFVIESTSDGSRLLTNYHVVAEAWTSYRRDVRLTGGEMNAVGTIVAVDAEADLAVVDVDAELPNLQSTTSSPRPGAQVLVIGAPLGLEGTITVGLISGVREGFLQLSAPVSPGSSGSPVLDAEGGVVGVISWKFAEPGAEGLSFAVPITKACEKLISC